MTDQMPQVNAEFGTTPVIEFPTPEAPKGLKVVELTEGDGPIVRRGDTVTVNYHGVVWGKDTPFDSSFDRHQPASFPRHPAGRHRRRGHAGVRHRHHFHPLTIGQHMTNAGVIAGVLS